MILEPGFREPDGYYAIIPAPKAEWESILLWFPDGMGGSIKPTLRSVGTDVEIRVHDLTRCANAPGCEYDLPVARFYLEGDYSDRLGLTDVTNQLYEILDQHLTSVGGEGPIAVLDFFLVLEKKATAQVISKSMPSKAALLTDSA